MRVITVQYIETQNFDQIELEKLFEIDNNIDSVVVSSGAYELIELPGIIAYENGKILGLLSYKKFNDYIEIISLHSNIENIGIGSNLITKTEEIAINIGIKRIKVITTNENLRALYFYQKKGYRITEILPNAVDKARTLKPTIPLVGENGIEIKDEIVLIRKI
ncbi:GNAT family N-acetyltransferase [Staphylococcus gallinarum]|nr:GNAT family N-acetyltransferase [Staphylococcus gallinarum]PTK89352.1 GNAT family N-acetyltransferase [Staphylococcus gallinarum]PTL06460.1 GNAT family N-acetyltransferase [Staphylococcus gallinarum]PTL08415.1 GNAT family N-acetyltransferase [Staphylococcus gallinarum]RIL34034.1 GNAT family N-acetyltransferase [Staphylococcus gallinarum]